MGTPPIPGYDEVYLRTPEVNEDTPKKYGVDIVINIEVEAFSEEDAKEIAKGTVHNMITNTFANITYIDTNSVEEI